MTDSKLSPEPQAPDTAELTVSVARAIATRSGLIFEKLPDHAYAAGSKPLYLQHAEAALEAIEEMGYAIVPVEPTEAMIEATGYPKGVIDNGGGSPIAGFVTNIWRDMLAARPR